MSGYEAGFFACETFLQDSVKSQKVFLINYIFEHINTTGKQ